MVLETALDRGCHPILVPVSRETTLIAGHHQ